MIFVKPAARIMEELLREYRKRPKGWKMLKTRDRMGFTDLFFYGGGKLWQIKGETKSPYEMVGLGAKIADKVDDRIERILAEAEPFHFGLATLHPSDEMKMIIVAGTGGESRISPLSFLSENQRELDSKLRRELEKLCEREGLRVGYG